jgi:hypothetical protein
MIKDVACELLKCLHIAAAVAAQVENERLPIPEPADFVINLK